MRLIDGDELLEKMYRYTDNEGAKMPYGDDDSLIHRDSACFLIENAPTIEPEPHWIPTSKERPPQYQEIWITDGLGNVELVYGKDGKWLLDDYFYTEPEIIAWMPANVPEPYRPKEDES